MDDQHANQSATEAWVQRWIRLAPILDALDDPAADPAPLCEIIPQFNDAFRFSDAKALVPYLQRLGASDLYASPLFATVSGSTHGYDVTDPLGMNPRLGTEREFEALAQELRDREMGLLLDIVPNHMAASPENPWWADVLENGRERVHAFVFGTRLTNITRQLRHKDVDLALDSVVETVDDWSGGTRIGDCLHDFNQYWSRRVLGQGAIVVLISDGLDRAGGEGLAHEMERLHKSCRRLIWLNPLLRFEGFEPKSQGIRAILPHVDEFRPVHNLQSLTELVAVLNRPVMRRQEGLDEWQQAI